jgi:hypothetical protein
MFVVQVNGIAGQWERRPLADAARTVAEAHQNGDRWDVRKRTTGLGYRVLTEPEAAELIAAVTKELN